MEESAICVSFDGLGRCFRGSYDCVYVGAGCDPAKTMDYLKGLLNVGGVMVAPFGEELLRVEVSHILQPPITLRTTLPRCSSVYLSTCTPAVRK